jgi:hypothetical protein
VSSAYQIILSILGIVIAALIGALVTTFFRWRDERTKLESRVMDLERQIGIYGSQIAPINAAYQAMLIKQLTHYHTPEMDALMVKLGTATIPPTINDQEMKRLIVLLDERTRDMGPEISEDERDAAEILPILLRKVKREWAAAEEKKKLNGKIEFEEVLVVGKVQVPGETDVFKKREK